MNTALHFSAQTCRWATPDGLFQQLSKEFAFTLDVAADDTNHKCARYYTAEQDGLLQAWSGTVWCNPPYGDRIGDWVAKACLERANGITTVLLLPVRTDTRWFHAYVLGQSEIRFIKGRLKFGESKDSAPFPSMLIIYRP